MQSDNYIHMIMAETTVLTSVKGALMLVKSILNGCLSNLLILMYTGQNCTDVSQSCTDFGQGCTEAGQGCIEAGQGCIEVGQGYTEAGQSCIDFGQGCT